jgi:hypothetical protein
MNDATDPGAPPGMGRPSVLAGGLTPSRGSHPHYAVDVRETTDPEVVVTEITHHGWSHVTGAPYRFTALGVIRVRDGEIVCYDDYMDPIALARLLGRTGELAAALTGA